MGCCFTQIGKLDSATTMPHAMVLPLHNEASYNPRPYTKIMLLCLHAAARGGENLLARTADVTAHISPETLQRFDDNGGVR